MKHKNTPLFLCIFFLLWLIYPAVLEFTGDVVYDFKKFTEIFRSILIGGTISFLLLVTITTQDKDFTSQPFHNRSFYWLAGFFIPIVFTLVVVTYVNPHARFSANRFQPVTPGARLAKAKLFENAIQSSKPEIVILGSSRAFTLSPSYIEEQTGYKTYNMSVEGGRTGDFIVEINHMLSLKTIPRVLVIDVNTETFGVQFFPTELQPLTLLPYMSTEQRINVAKFSLQDILGVQSLSDSFFLLYLPEANLILRTWSFQRDGMAIRKPLTEEQYKSSLEKTIEQRIRSQHCQGLNLTAQQRFEELITLAKNNGIGVVLYISPIHEKFYKAAYENNPDLFNTCRNNQLSYLTSLTDKYQNLQFRDLLELGTVVYLDDLGFYDAVHITPYAGEMIIDELLQPIEQVYEWSLIQQ